MVGTMVKIMTRKHEDIILSLGYFIYKYQKMNLELNLKRDAFQYIAWEPERGESLLSNIRKLVLDFLIDFAKKEDITVKDIPKFKKTAANELNEKEDLCLNLLMGAAEEQQNYYAIGLIILCQTAELMGKQDEQEGE